ncbi:MAG: hypothetical protein AVDCRST_MAG93-418 [uncultured Chloroflexia bacterium]|uniref:Uncharacterized protein n=1 Tax=uncultured Chloroflexia bacterium TaxID=1672391 RepID=A0A6J4HC88_9CHLR|nr:MAG: hypothetical protein AVDCRST_MAG93-418 [uncultured Chloroflexia bacterium]
MRPAGNYLPTALRVGPTVPPVVEEDLRPVIGFDDALPVGQEGPVTATVRVVGGPEPPGNTTFASALADAEELALEAVPLCQARAPDTRELDPGAIKRLQSHSTSPRLNISMQRDRIVTNFTRNPYSLFASSRTSRVTADLPRIHRRFIALRSIGYLMPATDEKTSASPCKNAPLVTITVTLERRTFGRVLL